MQFKTDENQIGTQIGLKNQALSWTLLWQILDAVGWQGDNIQSSHPSRVILLNGEKHATDALSLNPAFTDWMMGWPSGWTDPLLPVTAWSRWLRHMRGALCELNLKPEA
ncbi:hypothetical protein JI58_08115 [Marinosulfonomonas sp. PRT-SC04]|nr:hypothetical protein JI58_08115 [Marinosulfonomonas sp. PRT-SC04]